MNPTYEPSDNQPESLARMASMFGTPAMPTPTMVAMQRAQKITTDLKFAIKRLGQTETEIPKERLVDLVDRSINRCRGEIMVVAIQQKAISNLETIRNQIESTGTLPE
jgi:hypothetical protein